MGKNLELDNKNLFRLGLGAILHDIGKGKIPTEILLKPGPLTEEEFNIMKSHTTYGYEIIKNSSNLDMVTANIALQHHEHWDGNGYPLHLKENDINVFARIVTICDIYDALTANRVYRGRILPHEAAEYIINSNGVIADPSLTKNFVQNVAMYPIGATVLLSTGEIGRVSEIHNAMPLRPVIDIFAHRDSEKRILEHKLNLMDELTIFIVDVIN
jgi:HD-GYP domain-containing protein (c-di-GMP phosphodiesterase class II)